MSSKTIKYISYFDTQDSVIARNYVTSAANKLEYIARSLSYLGYKVDIVSMSEVIEEKFKIYLSEKKQISKDITLYLPFSWGGNSKFLKWMKILWHLVSMLYYLIFRCNSNDTVIVYHSLGYFDIIRWAKKIKKFKLILEVEEIYTDVSEMKDCWKTLEYKMFEVADAFIFSNDLLDAKVNKKHRPSIVIYGPYQVEPFQVEKNDDGKIHVIYAGTFDPNKGGAQTAISSLEFLPENYHIHICGFGSNEDVENIRHMIIEVQKKSRATITYDGLKKGNDFINFLQQCHIGLSTQKPDGEYNDTSFPSKVITYMANGLAVVSIKIPVLEKTTIAEAICFYEKADGESLAHAIMNCNYHKSSRKLLDSLDEAFKLDLKTLM